MALVRVYVTLKPSLLDSAGRTVKSSLQKLGFDEVEDCRIGKLIELQMANPTDVRIREMCQELLANPVIENFSYEVVAEAGATQ